MSRFMRRVTALFLCGTLVAFMAIPASPGASVDGAVRADTPVEAVVAGPGEVVGSGWLETALCIGCVAVIGAAGGGTIAGVLVVAAIAPEAIAGCALGCMLAFGGD